VGEAQETQKWVNILTEERAHSKDRWRARARPPQTRPPATSRPFRIHTHSRSNSAPVRCETATCANKIQRLRHFLRTLDGRELGKHEPGVRVQKVGTMPIVRRGDINDRKERAQRA